MLLVHYTFSHSTGHSTGHSVVRPAWVFMWQIALLLRQTSSLIESDLHIVVLTGPLQVGFWAENGSV